jgi:hypothetical protein
MTADETWQARLAENRRNAEAAIANNRSKAEAALAQKGTPSVLSLPNSARICQLSSLNG